MSRGRGPAGAERTGRASGRPLRRAVLVLPSAFTLGNLFFGLWAIVSVMRGDLALAGWLVVLAAVADWLDGRAARLSASHSRFGAELDSLVDLVSFGVAPGLIAYRLFFSAGDWSWVVCFLFVAAVALRLARFNVEQHGMARHHFLGLPSPAAGGLIATFFPFSQTAWFADQLAGWPWARIVAIGMVSVAALMLSHVPYPVLRPGLKSGAGRASLIVLAVAIPLLLWRPAVVALPLLVLYAAYGAGRAFVEQLQERVPSPEVLDELRRGRRGEPDRDFPWPEETAGRPERAERGREGER